MAHQAHLDGHQSQAEPMFTFTAISFTAPARGQLDSDHDAHVRGEAEPEQHAVWREGRWGYSA